MSGKKKMKSNRNYYANIERSNSLAEGDNPSDNYQNFHSHANQTQDRKIKKMGDNMNATASSSGQAKLRDSNTSFQFSKGRTISYG